MVYPWFQSEKGLVIDSLRFTCCISKMVVVVVMSNSSIGNIQGSLADCQFLSYCKLRSWSVWLISWILINGLYIFTSVVVMYFICCVVCCLYNTKCMQYIDQVVVIHADRNNYIEFVIMKIFTYSISDYNFCSWKHVRVMFHY